MFGSKKGKLVYKNKFNVEGDPKHVSRELYRLQQLVRGLDASKVKVKIEVEAFKK